MSTPFPYPPHSLSSLPPSSTTDSSSETTTNTHSHYNHVSVFDKFNISSLITNDLFIPKTSPHSFLYKREIEQKRPDPLHMSDSYQSVINEINKNHFDIKIDKLIIQYPNDVDIKFTSVYTPIKYIGEGAFGLVIAVMKKQTKEHCAVKIIKKNYNLFSNTTYLNEVALLKKLKHPRILHLHEVLDTNEYLFLFTDYIEGGSLKDFIIAHYANEHTDYFIKDSECATIIRSLLEAVAYLHKNNVMHRDLKPENIMFKNKSDLNSLVICDFGIAGEIETFEFTNSKCGTLLYMAPEILKNRPYDFLVDLWSVGIILYILESGGKHPVFEHGIDKKEFIKETIAKKEWEFPLHFPNVARNLFMKLCKRDSFFRYRTDKALKHPWIIRQVNKEIPLTLVEVFEKEDKVKRFKYMLLCSVMIVHLYRDVSICECEKVVKSSSFRKRNVIINIGTETKNASLTNLNGTFRLSHNSTHRKESFVNIRDKIHNNKEFESKYYLANISHINNDAKYQYDVVHTPNDNFKYKAYTYRNEFCIKKTKTHSHMFDSLLTRENGLVSTKGFHLKSLHTQSSTIQRRNITYFAKHTTRDKMDVISRNNSNKKMILKLNKSPVKLISLKSRLTSADDYGNSKVCSSRVFMLKDIKNANGDNVNKPNRIKYNSNMKHRVKTSRVSRHPFIKCSYGNIKKEYE